MALKLKTAAGKVFGGNDEIDRILALPMTKLRIELKQAFQDKKFSAEQYDSFVDRLVQLRPEMAKQAKIAKDASAAREAPSAIDIELNGPEKQLLWAATLTRMMQTGKDPVRRSKLWEQLESTVGMHNEAIAVSKVIGASLQNDDTTFDWGQPGTWFYYDPHKNHINLDLYYMMLTGFEHVRAVNLHEIGHSELSNTYSPHMKELYEKVKGFIDPRTVDGDADGDAAKPKKKYKKSEIKQIEMDVYEWQLRFKLWHMTEDNVVNQFSTNMRQQLPQDFGDSLNYVCTILQGFGEMVRGDDRTRDVKIGTEMPKNMGDAERDVFEQNQKKRQAEANQKRDDFIKFRETPLTPQQIADVKAGNISPEIASKMFDQIKTTVLLAFYEKNGLFTGKDKNWERFRILPDDIRKTVDVSKVPGANGRDAFQFLYDLSVGTMGASRDIVDLPLDRNQLSRFMAKGKTPEQEAEAARKLLTRNELLGKDGASAENPVETLIEQAAHARGIRNLQPKASDRMLVHEPHNNIKDSYRAVVAATSVQRGLLMEQIWDLYLKPYADVLMKEHEKKVDKELDKQQQKKNQQKQDKQDKGDKGDQGQPQQGGDDGEPQQGGEGGEQSPGDGEQSPGQDGGGGGRKYDMEDEDDEGGGEPGEPGEGEGDGAEDDPEMDMSDDLKDRVGDMAENPGEQRDKENGTGKGKGKDKKNDGEKNDGKGEGEGGEKADGDKPENGEEGEKAGGPGWDQDNKPQEPKKPKKVGDLKNKSVVNEDLTDEQKEKMKEAAQNMSDSKPSDSSSDNGGNGAGIDLAELAKGDWTDYARRVQELAPVINLVANAFKQIRKEQRRTIMQQAKTHEFMADDGDIQSRLDKDKVLETKFKQASKQPLQIGDFQKMLEDKTAMTESTIEIFSLIDGSASMPSFKLGNGTTAMEVSIQSAVIVYEACLLAGIDSFIYMWGDKQPRLIATPTTPRKEVGKLLQSFRDGINSGTDLDPAVIGSVDVLAHHKNKNGTVSGSSHMLVFSDGDIGDFAQAVDSLVKFASFSKNMSMDVAVLRPDGDMRTTRMEQAIQTVMDKSGNRVVGMLRGNQASKVPLDLARLMLQRVRSFKVKSEPDPVKRKHIKALHARLLRKD